jgi:Flp pilus assembly protein TadD
MNWQVQNALGETALQLGNRERAISSFRRATELDPKEPAYKLHLDAARSSKL